MTFSRIASEALVINLFLVHTPLFNVLIGAKEKNLYWTSLHDKNEILDPQSIITLNTKCFSFEQSIGSNPFWDKIIDATLKGRAIDPPIKLNVQGTEFQRSVWEALLKIPYGETRSYQQIASEIGRPKSVRATGSAIGKNPLSLFIPCHRVIRTDKQLGGYAWGLSIKMKLLEIETKIS